MVTATEAKRRNKAATEKVEAAATAFDKLIEAAGEDVLARQDANTKSWRNQSTRSERSVQSKPRRRQQR